LSLQTYLFSTSTTFHFLEKSKEQQYFACVVGHTFSQLDIGTDPSAHHLAPTFNYKLLWSH